MSYGDDERCQLRVFADPVQYRRAAAGRPQRLSGSRAALPEARENFRAASTAVDDIGKAEKMKRGAAVAGGRAGQRQKLVYPAVGTIVDALWKAGSRRARK